MPKGKPTTSTERMRLKKLRDQGKLPPIKTCSVCGKKLKKGAGANKAWEAGLCWFHWSQTEEGKIERRRPGLVGELWPVYYFGGPELVPCTSIRKALTASVNKGGRDNHPIFIVWSDGIVTSHCCLTARTAVGIKQDDGDQLIDDYESFLAMVPEHLRTWFDN